tara:strand:- start:3480 stop:3821 length:342 start_codon:yes stop_codon:yes gene_type:complete
MSDESQLPPSPDDFKPVKPDPTEADKVAYHFKTVLDALGVTVTNGMTYAAAAEQGVLRVDRLQRAADAIALIEAADDALTRFSPRHITDAAGLMDLREARTAIAKAKTKLRSL